MPTPALIRADLLAVDHFIHGQWRAPALAGERYDVRNPASGLAIAQVAKAGQAETELAIAAAAQALPDWRGQTAKFRSAVLRRWADLMLIHQEDLALLLSTEQGKPLTEARGEVAYAASFLEWFSEEAKRAYGDVIPSHKPGSRIVVLKEAVGVVAAITPWNFPLAMVTRKVGPALAAGCTVVLKPSEETPLSAHALAVLGMEAGVPPGVLNIVSGDAVAIGSAMMASEAVRKISFTGSTRVGKLLMAQAAHTMKKVSLELGGNAPFIVFNDADIDAAVAGAMASKFRNSGQTCVCVNRFFVQDGVYEAFTHKLAEAAARLKVAPATDPLAEQGPLINAAAVHKVQRHLADAVQRGAQVLTGGDAHRLGGTFFQPTVVVNATGDMEMAQEETFGPVAACYRFTTEAEVLEMANDTRFGLAAYFYTRDLARAWRVAERLETGMVGINEGMISTELAPFGGIKESGLGREGSHYGLEDYLEPKYVLMGGLHAA